MHPHFNSRPCRPNQVQNDGTTSDPAAQQAIPFNFCQGNTANLFPNYAQIQPQMGVINPHSVMAFNNFNTRLSNGTAAMSNRPVSSAMGAPNHPFQMQNGMPSVMSQFGQCNSNPVSMTLFNPTQQPSQFCPPNSMNLPQVLNQNAFFPNGQQRLQGQMQNINQFVQMPMSNYPQLVPCNMQMYPNQGSQALASQNPTYFVNPQFGMVQTNAAVQPSNPDQQKFLQATPGGNTSRQLQNTTQQSQGNSHIPPGFGPVPVQQTQKNFRPPGFTKSQGNHRNNVDGNSTNNNWKNSQNRNFAKNLKRDASHMGSAKSQFHNMQNTKGKFAFRNKYSNKGNKNDEARTCGSADSLNQIEVKPRRTVSLNYTEQEIQQWREERRKNFPSKSNIEKVAQKLTEPEVAKLRRQQLKDILAKQAELGCEVAEIPSYYFLESQKQVQGKELVKNASTKEKRFQNKFNRKGRHRQNGGFGKKQPLADNDSSNLVDQQERFPKKQKFTGNGSSLNNRQPSLLQKLLSADIRTDKSRLLQVFRFMVMNSFFKDWPEKPLNFPLVIVKDTSSEGEVVEEKFPSSGQGVYDKKTVGDDEHDAQVKEADFDSLKGSIGGEDEEEGEIID